MRWSMPAPIVQVATAGYFKLPILPNEIYLCIIDFVHYSIDWDEDDRRRSLSNLALSCVLFRGFIVPRIFKSLHFNGGEDDLILHSAVNSAVFCRALNNGNEPAISLVQYVEECTLVNWNSSAANPAINTAFMKMYCRAFLRMPNLRNLSLSNVIIDAHLLKTICKLKSLQSLVLTGIDLPKNIIIRLLNKMPPITSLRLDWPEKPSSGKEESLDSIVTRVVNGVNLQKLSATRCVQVLPILPQTSALVELYLTAVESTAALWNAIGCLEALTIFKMMFVTVRPGTPLHQLTASSLSRLRHLTAPPSFSSIVANRPLSYINLIDGIQTNQTIQSAQIIEMSQCIAQSSTSLTSLLIPFEFYSVRSFWEKFPDLQTLTILYGHPNFSLNLYQSSGELENGFCRFKSFVREVATKWPPASSVKSLKLDMRTTPWDIQNEYLYDLELQCGLILQIVRAFPNVHRVQFFSYLEWTRQSNKENWTGYIPFEFHSRIREDLNHDQYVRKDAFGLLHPFITPDIEE